MYGTSELIRGIMLAATIALRRNWRLRLRVLLVRRCRRPILLRTSLPDPDRFSRFAADLFVLIFGIAMNLSTCVLTYLGASIIFILRPSIMGWVSIWATSSRTPATFRSSRCPNSVWARSRPRNSTKQRTLLPSSRNWRT